MTRVLRVRPRGSCPNRHVLALRSDHHFRELRCSQQVEEGLSQLQKLISFDPLAVNVRKLSEAALANASPKRPLVSSEVNHALT